MWLLIVPVLILGALILTSLLASVLWAIGATWPWLLIGLGMWLFWHGDGRHHRVRHRRLAWETGSRHRSGTAGEQSPPVQSRPVEKPAARRKTPAAPRQPELPIDVQVKVEQIRRKVDVLLS